MNVHVCVCERERERARMRGMIRVIINKVCKMPSQCRSLWRVLWGLRREKVLLSVRETHTDTHRGVFTCEEEEEGRGEEEEEKKRGKKRNNAV